MLRHNSSFAAMLIILCLVVFSACNPDNDFLEIQELDSAVSSNSASKSFVNVDPSLWPYFQRFEEQAALRGLSINLNELELTGGLEDLPGENVGGQCTWHSNNPNHITIDEPLFNDLSDLYREFIIFHELGHCVLNRDHREDTNQHGNCVSLMRSGLESCNDNYNSGTRIEYINELFNPSGF